MGRVRARVEVKGPLAFIETEYGERAVVPADTLCSFLVKYGIEAEGEGVDCSRVESVKPVAVEVDIDESEEED